MKNHEPVTKSCSENVIGWKRFPTSVDSILLEKILNVITSNCLCMEYLMMLFMTKNH